MKKTLLGMVFVITLSGCSTPHLKINSEGRVVGRYWQNKTIQQIEFYEDGRVKRIQYWKQRPKNAGWVIDF